MMFKRWMAAAVIAAFALSFVPGGALAKEALEIKEEREFTFKTPDSEATVFTLKNNRDTDVEATVEVYDQAARKVVQTMTLTLMAGDTPTPVPARVYNKMVYDDEITTYRYTIKAPGVTERLYYGQKLNITKNSAGETINTYKQVYNSYYPNNTVSSFGPHFRDVTPNLTDLWYMFTPIDLSLQGRQTFVLAASNMYEVGWVHVDVQGDGVIVTYEMMHGDEPGFTTETHSEFLTFYNEYADVGIVEPEDMPGPSAFAFGRPFSISYDLGGDTNVLMFVRNRITYFQFPAPKSEYIRFWENKDEYETRREGMLNMMDPITGVQNEK